MLLSAMSRTMLGRANGLSVGGGSSLLTSPQTDLALLDPAPQPDAARDDAIDLTLPVSFQRTWMRA